MPQHKPLPEKDLTALLEDDSTPAIDGEVIEVDSEVPIEIAPSNKYISAGDLPAAIAIERQRSIQLYLLLPFIFLTVTLLGGLRLASPGNDLVFLKPALFCLILAVILVILFIHGGLIAVDGWLNEEFPMLTNIANGAVLVTVFAASTQLFNSLIPEQGLPFWIVAFCFVWTLWNNLFANFDNKKLLRSIVALFGFAFVAKYLILANLTAPASESWVRGILENPAKEALTWILSLPKYSAGTGYIQFFAVLLYFLGLLLLPRTTRFGSIEK